MKPHDAGPPAVVTRDAGRTRDAGFRDAGSVTSMDAGTADAGVVEPRDGGSVARDGGTEDLYCDGVTMRDVDGATIATYESGAVCSEVLAARGDGVVCRYFNAGDPIGPGGWDETGWRAMNWRTGIGLGRRPHLDYDDCLEATRNARGGVVCTNTGVGYKSANIETNMWCGSSSALSYCLQASAAARDFWVCSFPSDGDGSGPGWNLTHIDGSTCDYTTGGLYLDDCNARIP